MKRTVYADNAATTQLDMDAFEAMRPYLLSEYGNASQSYSFSRASRKALKDARSIIATCIGADPDEIFFTSGGTESDNWAIKGTMTYGDHRSVVTSAFEHHAILHACSYIERHGYPVAYVYPTCNGIVSPSNLSAIISTETKLVSVMMANNELGTIQPIRDLCQIAHEHGALFHTDAVQAIGHIPVDVHALGVDLLSASAHKFNGPKGVGFLYIRKGVKIESLLDGGAQENHNRAGTENVAGIVGMATALKANCCAMEQSRKHLTMLEKRLLNNLDRNSILYKRNGNGDYLPGLLSLAFPGCEGEMLLHRLDLMGISVSTGSACNSVDTEISHVLQAINLEESYAKGTIRISLGKNNTVDDVDIICAAIKKIVG